MTWNAVPWFVGGGAEHSASAARAAAFALSGGREGVVQNTHLAVTAQSTPNGTVNIAPGSALAVSRATGHQFESYHTLLTAAETVEIAPTGASGGRSDLIVVRVEDPNVNATYATPEDVANGPYVFTRVITNVPSTTTSLEQVAPGDTGIALARIDIPASTSAITSAMIVDLRRLVNPRKDRYLNYVGPIESQQVQGSGAGWQNIALPAYNPGGPPYVMPEWAQYANLRVNVDAVQVGQSSLVQYRAAIFEPLTGADMLGIPGTVGGGENGYEYVEKTLLCGGPVPAALRGHEVQLLSQFKSVYWDTHNGAPCWIVSDAPGFVTFDLEVTEDTHL